MRRWPGKFTGRANALLLAVLLIQPECRSQPALTGADSLRKKLAADSAHIYRKTLAKPYLRLEKRNSFVNATRVDFFGFLAGANLHNRHIVSAGYYVLDVRSRAPVTTSENTGSFSFRRMSYVNFCYQYIVHNSRYIQIHLPLEAGYGRYRALVAGGGTSPSEIVERGNFIPLACGAQFIVKALKSAGVTLISGYRYAYHDSEYLRFEGFFYALGVWIDARQIYRDVRWHRTKKRYRREVGRHASPGSMN